MTTSSGLLERLLGILESAKLSPAEVAELTDAIAKMKDLQLRILSELHDAGLSYARLEAMSGVSRQTLWRQITSYKRTLTEESNVEEND